MHRYDMLIYADSGIPDEIRAMQKMISISGITTNPKLATIKQATELAMEFNLPTSMQIDVRDEEYAYKSAYNLCQANQNHVIKVPISHIELGKRIIKHGGVVNFTLCMSFAQAIAAINVGAQMISVFIGRLLDHNLDPGKVIKQIREYIDLHHFTTTSILAASIRNRDHLEIAAESGAHIVTIPPKSAARVFDLGNEITLLGRNDFDKAFD